jgi:hypothetical protein
VDWGHVALGVAVIVAVFARWRHSDRRSITWIFKWDKERTDESDRRHQ